MASAATSSLRSTASAVLRDDRLTVCAIAIAADMLGTMLHEGLGHACTALLTIAPQGVLSTVAWSSAYDSKLVDAAGTLVNLAAAAVFWILLRYLRPASIRVRLFLLLSCAFNLFAGTGYFLFSGVTDFGDWADVIYGFTPHALWRTGLIVVGILAYWAAVVIVGSALVRYVGVPLTDTRRFQRLCLASYLSAIGISTLGGLMNPAGLKFVLLSALPASAGAQCGLLWMRYYIPRSTAPLRPAAPLTRSWAWIGSAGLAALVFIFVLGRGITLHR